MLQQKYDKVMEPLEKGLKKLKELSLQVDCWSARSKAKMFAALACPAEDEPVLVKSGTLVQTSHTAAELLEHLKEVPEYVKERWVCVLSDGDSTAVAAAKRLKEEYPELYTLVCCAHTLARCVNDAVGTRKESRAEVKNEFAQFAQLITTLTTRIRNVEYLLVKYDATAKQLGKPAKRLVLPAVTRWTTFSEVWRDLKIQKETLMLMKEDDKV